MKLVESMVLIAIVWGTCFYTIIRTLVFAQNIISTIVVLSLDCIFIWICFWFSQKVIKNIGKSDRDSLHEHSNKKEKLE